MLSTLEWKTRLFLLEQLVPVHRVLLDRELGPFLQGAPARRRGGPRRRRGALLRIIAAEYPIKALGFTQSSEGDF